MSGHEGSNFDTIINTEDHSLSVVATIINNSNDGGEDDGILHPLHRRNPQHQLQNNKKKKKGYQHYIYCAQCGKKGGPSSSSSSIFAPKQQASTMITMEDSFSNSSCVEEGMLMSSSSKSYVHNPNLLVTTAGGGDDGDDDHSSFLTCACGIFHYCSTICCRYSMEIQQSHTKRDCKILRRFKAKSMNVQYAGLLIDNEYKCFLNEYQNNNTNHQDDKNGDIESSPASSSFDKRCHIYEVVLDEYIIRHDEVKAMGMSTDVGISAHNDFNLIKPRIPMLLASLQLYDDYVISELAMTMDITGQATRTSISDNNNNASTSIINTAAAAAATAATSNMVRRRSKYDDLLHDLLMERNLHYTTWPICFLLPLLLVKLRLTLDYDRYVALMVDDERGNTNTNHKNDNSNSGRTTTSSSSSTNPTSPRTSARRSSGRNNKCSGSIFPYDVRLYIGEFIIGSKPPSKEILRDQKRQLSVIADLLVEQDETFLSLVEDDDKIDDRNRRDDYDIIAYNFDGDYDYNDRGLFHFFKDCFRQPKPVKELYTKVIEQAYMNLQGQDYTWERGA